MKKLIQLSFFTLIVIFGCQKESNSSASETSDAGNSVGKSGSMAKYIIHENYMYMQQGPILNIYQIGNSKNPILISQFDTKRGDIETLFANNDNLFYGTMSGMIIYSIKNRMAPEYVSEYRHIVSCDPVVVDGNLAYVTLSAETQCRGVNQLDIIDISDIKNPIKLISYPFKNPKGMAINNGIMYLCNGTDGLLVLDSENYKSVKEISSYKNIHAYDCILNNNVLTVTGKTGIYQFDCSDNINLKLLSKI